MKEELVEKVNRLYESLEQLNEVWSRLDWSVVPEEVGESYPFHQDLLQMQEGVEHWLRIIKKS